MFLECQVRLEVDLEVLLSLDPEGLGSHQVPEAKYQGHGTHSNHHVVEHNYSDVCRIVFDLGVVAFHPLWLLKSKEDYNYLQKGMCLQ